MNRRWNSREPGSANLSTNRSLSRSNSDFRMWLGLRPLSSTAKSYQYVGVRMIEGSQTHAYTLTGGRDTARL